MRHFSQVNISFRTIQHEDVCMHATMLAAWLIAGQLDNASQRDTPCRDNFQPSDFLTLWSDHFIFEAGVFEFIYGQVRISEVQSVP